MVGNSLSTTQEDYYTGLKQVNDDYQDDFRVHEAQIQASVPDEPEILLGTAEASSWTPASPEHPSEDDEAVHPQLTPAQPVIESAPSKPAKRPAPKEPTPINKKKGKK